MILETLKSHLNETPECTVIYQEISALCGSNLQAAMMLSKFLFWSDVAEKMPDAKQRCGWFYKTAAELKNELGFTRRAYEKARKCLLNLGVIQYRRGGVHGKMHWRVNFSRLVEWIYKITGKTMPKEATQRQIDQDNTEIPKWIPIDAWNAYLLSLKEQGKHASNQEKSKFIKQLAKLRKQWDLTFIIEHSMAKGWFGFFPPNQHVSANITVPDPEADKIMAQIQAAREHQAACKHNPPPKPLSTADKQQKIQSMVSMLLKKQFGQNSW